MPKIELTITQREELIKKRDDARNKITEVYPAIMKLRKELEKLETIHTRACNKFADADRRLATVTVVKMGMSGIKDEGLKYNIQSLSPEEVNHLITTLEAKIGV